MLGKFNSYRKKLRVLDLGRKIIYFINGKLRFSFFRSIKSYYYFKNASIKLGQNIRIKGVSFNISVGNKTSFYDNCIFELGHNSEIRIGSNVVFSYGVLFCCIEKIVIGNDVQIGEYTSLRDSTHQYGVFDRPMKYVPDISSPIVIENDVWIGRGCIVLPGTFIEEGVVVAANSVVKGRLKRNGIYGGVPLKLLKFR